MRIVCDSCGAKYSISDDKVKGKVFKIRCKKCSNVIIVRGNQQPAEANAAAAAGGGEAVWYVVRGGQQDGPHSPEALQGLLGSGEINAETYTWREGFADWVPFSTVNELSHLMGGGVGVGAPSHMQEASMPVSADDGGFDDDGEATRVAAGLFDNAGPSSLDDMESTRMAPPPQAAPDPGMFEPEATQAFSPEEFQAPAPAPAPVAAQAPIEPIAGFAAVAPASPDLGSGMPMSSAPMSIAGASPSAKPSGGARNGNKSDMVGARSENSVLFSLNNLGQGDDGGGEPEEPTNTEASGLIDIRALSSSAAAVSNARAGGADLPDPLAGPMAAGPAISVPDMMPMGTRKSSAPLVIAIGVGLFLILLVGGGLAALFLFKDNQPEKIVMNNPNAAAANANANATGDEAPAKDDKKDEAKDDSEKKDTEAAVAEKEDNKEEGDKEEGDKAEEGKEEGDDKAAATAQKDDEGDKAAAQKVAREDNRTPEQKRADLERLKEERERRERERKEREAAAQAQRGQEKEAAPAAKKGGGNDSIDDILSGIGGSKKPAPVAKKEDPAPVAKKEPATPPPAAAAQKLSKSDVQTVVRRYYGSVRSCANGESGTVMVRFTINPNGSVAGAKVQTSKFAGTPAGGCVTRVVRSMKFPTSSSPLTINFPFKL